MQNLVKGKRWEESGLLIICQVRRTGRLVIHFRRSGIAVYPQAWQIVGISHLDSIWVEINPQSYRA